MKDPIELGNGLLDMTPVMTEKKWEQLKADFPSYKAIERIGDEERYIIDFFNGQFMHTRRKGENE